MHMADALLAPGVAATMYAATGVATAFAARAVRRESVETEDSKIPAMGVMAAFVFAAQMINFSIPGTGSSGHLCGGMLLSGVLGPTAGFLSMICVLLVQCLFFADGGLLALGANVWNMAFYGCFIGGGVIWPLFVRKGTNPGRIFAASVLGSVVTLQLGALSVTLETLASGITELPFGVFIKAMLPIHLAIGLVEGLITGAVLSFVYQTRPALLWGTRDSARPARLGAGAVLATLAAAALVIGGLLSLCASGDPDGLEWSMEKVAGTAELEGPADSAHEKAGQIQEKLSFLPDYDFPAADAAADDVAGDTAGAAAEEDGGISAGTTVSGIVGSLMVLVLGALACALLKMGRSTAKANA